MLTIGYIGNGKSTNRYHLPFVLQRTKFIRVKTIYNHQIKTFAWDKIPGVFYTDQLDALLLDPEIEAIVVCTRHYLHYEYAKKVLESGKHCIVEKPFMSTSKEAQEIFDLAREKGLLVQAYQNRRFDSDFLTTQAVIERGVLGDLLEVEMHYDYFRPEIPESIHEFVGVASYLYGHGCHTLDQVISYFGEPDHVHYDVRQLLGEGRMNDYFDLDLMYGNLKVSVKSSYFRVKERPSFVVYGKRGYFVKEKKDRQEVDLKKFYMPTNPDFGLDTPEDYGTLIYYDDHGQYHEEKVKTVPGDYGRVYDDFYQAVVHGNPLTITEDHTMAQMRMLETGVAGLK